MMMMNWAFISASFPQDFFISIAHNTKVAQTLDAFNSLNAELNPMCHLLTLLGAHPIFHISRIRVNMCLSSSSEVNIK